MTTYRKRDLRAADVLSMILVGLGLVFVVFAVYRVVAPIDVEPKADKRPNGPASSFGLWLVAVTFLSLGMALQLKIRQLIRTGGREPESYEGVPE